MSAWAVASILFACLLGAALLGMLLRAALPEHHLGDGSKDVVRVGMAFVATMSALVLSLLIAAAKDSHDTQRNGIDQLAANIALLDIVLAQFGPEARDARDLLRRVVGLGLAQAWQQHASPTSTSAPPVVSEGRNLYAMIQALAPRNEMQARLQSQALQVLADVGRERWFLAARAGESAIPAPFLVILGFWLVALFASFGLFAPPNAVVVGTLMVCALSVAGAMFLILELAGPFEGLVQVSSAPLRDALPDLRQ